MYRLRFETLQNSSNLAMQKIKAVTMKLRRTQMSNSEIMEENLRYQQTLDDLQRQIAKMEKLKRHHIEMKAQELIQAKLVG
jgi:hypothetical protein